MERRITRRQVGRLALVAGAAAAAAGSPRPASAQAVSQRSWYFAEGSTGNPVAPYSGFDEYLTIANPNGGSARIKITYYFPNPQNLPGGSVIERIFDTTEYRTTALVHGFNPDDHSVGRNQPAFATTVESIARFAGDTNPPGIVVERPMYFNYRSTVTGGHVVLGVTAPRTAWYFAEGYTGTGFDEYLAIFNPHDRQVNVTVSYYKGDASTRTVTFVVNRRARETVAVHEDARGIGRPGGAAAAVSAKVETNDSGGIVVERAMYFTYYTGWTGGHITLGAAAPRTRWYFAEGYTGDGFDEFLTIMNPSTTDATIRITYYRTGAAPLQKTLTAPANRRTTVTVHDTAQGVGRGWPVSALVESTNGVGVLVERPMYFNYPGGDNIYGYYSATGGHVAFGYADVA
jgi:hypothetical protein